MNSSASGSGPSRSIPGHLVRVADDVDREPLPRARLGDVEPGVVVEDDPGGERRLVARPRRRRRAPSSRHRIQPARDRCTTRCSPEARDVEELAVPGDVVDQRAVERGQRRVVGLQRAERGDVDADDRAVGEASAQVLDQRLHLGQLGHARQSRNADHVTSRLRDGHNGRMLTPSPLPAHGQVFLDGRGDERSLRVSWHREVGVEGVVVLSLWRDGVCVGSFRIGSRPGRMTSSTCSAQASVESPLTPAGGAARRRHDCGR